MVESSACLVLLRLPLALPGCQQLLLLLGSCRQAAHLLSAQQLALHARQAALQLSPAANRWALVEKEQAVPWQHRAWHGCCMPARWAPSTVLQPAQQRTPRESYSGSQGFRMAAGWASGSRCTFHLGPLSAIPWQHSAVELLVSMSFCMLTT